MNGTARQAELLRDEPGQVQDGPRELRGGNDTLRTELLTAVKDGLAEYRGQGRSGRVSWRTQTSPCQEQRELAEAHKEIRPLRRQLDEARAGLLAAAPAEVESKVPGAGSSPSPLVLVPLPGRW